MITVSTDPTLLDTIFIHDFISQSYWAKGRTMEEVESIIRHSLNFGVYLNGKQVGYARILTDYNFFAYLLDVFIDPEHQGKGYSKTLMKYILDYPELDRIKTWRLGTTDAHGLYEQFGFQRVAKPENMMELFRDPKMNS
jgi:GNAT superfamily N-acetyltransferase